MNNTNDTLILGIMILIAGLFVASYSYSTYTEIKTLGNKIDFEELENNNEMSTSDKYYKYLDYADFLTKKLDKNKNIPMKNASCVYLDYAQHNAKSLYNLTTRKMDSDDSKRNVAAGNIRSLYNTLDFYRTCKQSANYKSELQALLDEIQNDNLKPTYSDMKMEKFLNGYDRNKFVEPQATDMQPAEEQDYYQAELEPIEKPDNFVIPEKY